MKQGEHSGPGMSRRKAQHLSICLEEETYTVETATTRLDEVHLIHCSLPEVDGETVDSSTTFLGFPISMPVFISSMTGGSEGAYQVNKDLATTAQELGIPVGMGSIRILFRKPEVTEHFLLKRYAPDVPVFANIGGVQLPEMEHGRIFRVLEELQVDGIAVHLNPGQEMVQPGGDRQFRGIRESLTQFVAACPVPVLVKETGFGINPAEIRQLLEIGAACVDVAGAGGTNWSRVEAYRLEEEAQAEAAAEFDSWGLPTALILAALGRTTRAVVASGGVRTGMDVLRSLALGAEAAGIALPFVRQVAEGGVAAAVAYGRQLQYVIRTGMTLCGCTRVSELRTAPIWLDRTLQEDAEALAQACRLIL